MERFWGKVDRRGPDDCWPWRAAVLLGGYGQFWFEGKQRKAHRVAYELVVGPIPDGLVIDHLCRTRHCVNPAHMEPVTSAENVRRGAHRNGHTGKTHCPQGHPYDGINLYVHHGPGRSRRRHCRTCLRAAQRRYRARRRSTRFSLLS